MTAPQPQTRETLVETVREMIEWQINWQTSESPDGPPSWEWPKALAALSVLAAQLDTAEEEALRFGGNVWRARAAAAERERDAARALVDSARTVLEAHYATAGWQTSEKGRLWDALDGLEVAWRATGATP